MWILPPLRHTGLVSWMGGRRVLGPLRARAPWVVSGLLLQGAGAGGLAAYVWLNVHRQGLGGHLSAATIQLAWHSEVHTRQGGWPSWPRGRSSTQWAASLWPARI